MLRVKLLQDFSDISSYVLKVVGDSVTFCQTTGNNQEKVSQFFLSDIQKVTEILSSPLFYRLRRLVAGEKVGNPNLVWKAQPKLDEQKQIKSHAHSKPKLLWHSLVNCQFRRA